MPFSNRPLYLQVRDALAERIASGGLRPGAAIPSEGDLAREIGVSAGTVRKALHLMETDRLIVRQQGRGTFVSDLSCSELAAARFTRLHGPNGARIRGCVKASRIARGSASPMERDRLRLCDGDEVYRIQRVWHEDATFLIEDATLPAELFPGLEQKGQVADQIAVLAQEYGILLGRARERVSTALPPAAVAEALGTPPTLPITVLDRVVFTFDDRCPVEWRVASSSLS